MRTKEAFCASDTHEVVIKGRLTKKSSNDNHIIMLSPSKNAHFGWFDNR